MSKEQLEALDEQALTVDEEDKPVQVWIRVQDAEKLILPENEKRHDIGALMTSIARYGFQEIAKYDATVQGIKAGNGRILALALMEREGRPVPRGIAVEKESGAWAVPMTVGVDARSRSEALAYLTDSNNLVLAGGDFDGFDMARLWGPGYVNLLSQMDELPVSVPPEILGILQTSEDIAEDWSDFDEQLEDLEGYDEVDIKITVPSMHEEDVIEWLANGEAKTAPGMGKGVLRRCGLL